jgi:hypothetical protein
MPALVDHFVLDFGPGMIEDAPHLDFEPTALQVRNRNTLRLTGLEPRDEVH